ncbi:MAG: hypothetical protein MUF31_10940 [Akkermansiaceae bacterium]|jgi:hypothetical protein|nr:hypothetical protein [Akkermansiaceae bacterium]
MEKSVRIKKILMFVGTGAGAYLLMWLLGQGGKAWETVRGNVTQQLTVLLSGGLAGVFAMLIPSQNKPQASPAPNTPADNKSGGDKPEVNPAVPAVGDSGAPAPAADAALQARCAAAEDEVGRWRAYGEEVHAYHARQAELQSILDTRQMMLRITLGGIVVLAFVVSLFSYFGPPLPQEGAASVAQELFMRHIGWVAGAHALVGFVTGAVVFRIRIHTVHRHAFKTAFVSAIVLNLTSMLMVTPYAFTMMWKQQVELFGYQQSMLVCTTAFRILLAPLAAGLLALGGFQLAKSFSRGV